MGTLVSVAAVQLLGEVRMKRVICWKFEPDSQDFWYLLPPFTRLRQMVPKKNAAGDVRHDTTRRKT